MKYYLKTRFREAPELKDDEKIRSWWEYTNELEFAFLEILNADLDAENGNQEQDKPSEDDAPTSVQWPTRCPSWRQVINAKCHT